jgi:hypothetical protein
MAIKDQFLFLWVVYAKSQVCIFSCPSYLNAYYKLKHVICIVILLLVSRCVCPGSILVSVRLDFREDKTSLQLIFRSVIFLICTASVLIARKALLKETNQRILLGSGFRPQSAESYLLRKFLMELSWDGVLEFSKSATREPLSST